MVTTMPRSAISAICQIWLSVTGITYVLLSTGADVAARPLGSDNW